MVPIRYWRMSLSNIVPKSSDKDVEILSAIPRMKRGVDGKPTEVIEGYNLSFLALKGCDQTVKLPLSAKPAVEELQKLLADKQTIVRVRFNNLIMRAFAINRGDLMTGISCSADGFEITSVEKPEVDDLIEFE